MYNKMYALRHFIDYNITHKDYYYLQLKNSKRIFLFLFFLYEKLSEIIYLTNVTE